jgi:hypothetical protein
MGFIPINNLVDPIILVSFSKCDTNVGQNMASWMRSAGKIDVLRLKIFICQES